MRRRLEKSTAHQKPRWRGLVRVRGLIALGIWLLVLGFLYEFDEVRTILLDLLAAATLAAMLRPLTRWLPGPHWLRGSIVGVSFVLLIVGIVFGFSLLLVNPIRHELRLLPQFGDSINALLFRWSHRLGLHQPLDVMAVVDHFARSSAGAQSAYLLPSAANWVVRFLVTVTLTFLGTIYLLVEPKGRFVHGIVPALSLRHQRQLIRTVEVLEFRLRFWLMGAIVAMVIVGSFSWVSYYFIHLNFALPLALFAGCVEIVPTVGSFTAFGVAILVAATQHSLFTLVGVIVTHSIILFFEAYVILPLIMRRAVSIPPVVTLFTVVFWAEVLGIGGLILAIPLDLTAWSAFDYFVIKPQRIKREEARTAPATQVELHRRQ